MIHCPWCNGVNIDLPMAFAKTAVGWQPFQDERGVHSHDPNRSSAGYSCRDCRTRWSRSWVTKCPVCDWGGDAAIQIEEVP